MNILFTMVFNTVVIDMEYHCTQSDGNIELNAKINFSYHYGPLATVFANPKNIKTMVSYIRSLIWVKWVKNLIEGKY